MNSVLLTGIRSGYHLVRTRAGSTSSAQAIMVTTTPVPPGTTHFDRKSLEVTKQLSAIRVPKRRCAEAMNMLRGHSFSMPRMKCLVDDPADQGTKLLLLSDSVLAGTLQGLPEPVKKLVEDAGFSVASHDLTIPYTVMSTEEVLKKLLPEGVDAPLSFETVGHIAHYNLREEHQPYRHLIGQVCLDKNAALRTVVTKVAEIGNEFRVFDMEVIAGEDNLVAELSQHGYRYRLDFSKVFWNSRLEHEHNRLVAEYFKPGEVIADIMAGIGPFAVPAAKAGCTVYSNDLNPDSTKWLKVNVKLNKVDASVHAFCMDGRAFVRCLCATPGGPADDFAALAAQRSTDDAPAPVPEGFQLPPGGVRWQHGVMNLPRTAVEFCDAFRGAFDPETWRGQLPLIHCYTFKKSETDADVITRVQHALGGELEEPPLIHVVRCVAPEKYHVCVTFRVPEAVAFHGREGPDAKRQKTAAPDESA